MLNFYVAAKYSRLGSIKFSIYNKNYDRFAFSIDAVINIIYDP